MTASHFLSSTFQMHTASALLLATSAFTILSLDPLFNFGFSVQ